VDGFRARHVEEQQHTRNDDREEPGHWEWG